MEVLGADLILKIDERPLDTLLRDDDEKIDKEYKGLLYKKNVKLPRTFFKVPDKFDGRKTWDGLLSPVKNQGSCSSCWAFATTSTLADRFNIQSMGLMNVDLSPTKLILCDARGHEFDIEHPETETEDLIEQQFKSLRIGACFGNTLYDAWRYLFTIGTNTLKCVPYNESFGQYDQYKGLGSFNNPVRMPLCKTISGPLGDMCSDYLYDTHNAEEHGTPAKFYRAFHFYAIAGTPKDGGSEYNIRHEIFSWGPVSSGMEIYSDFYTFDSKNEIYEWNGKGPRIGGHAVEIVGWGEEKGKKYWIIQNSWGIEWGDKGYFRMVRGVNNCKLEENIITGIPDYFYPTTYKSSVKFIWAESKDSATKRRDINFKLRSAGGGIDPETGYTRRVMTMYPQLNFSRPVELEDLPEWKSWVAGIDAGIKNRIKFQSIVNGKKTDIEYGNQTIYIVGSIVGILFIMLVIVLINFNININ